jgi:membrane-associated phospholipid phosphatase
MLLAIGVCYEWIDRPLCEWVYNHGLREHLTPIAGLVEWPPVITGIAPLLLLTAWLLPEGRPRQLLTLLGFSILLTFVLKNDLKWVFSRYWPMTWTHDNLSWIHNHAYGFQWFQGKPLQGNDQTGSFPSGHSAVAFAALLPVGIVYRRILPATLALAALEALSMVAFDYHFLSDVLAGTLVGISGVLLTDRLLRKSVIEKGS